MAQRLAGVRHPNAGAMQYSKPDVRFPPTAVVTNVRFLSVLLNPNSQARYISGQL